MVLEEQQPTIIDSHTIPSNKLSTGEFLRSKIEILSESSDFMDIKIGIENDTEIPVTGIYIDVTETDLEISQSKQLDAVIEPVNATNKELLWSSSNTNIATVSDKGLVTGISTGEAKITVKTVDGDKIATSIVKVSSKKEDDHGDTGETATKIKENEVVKGKINSEGDIDVFELDLPKGNDKTVVLESTNGYVPKYTIEISNNRWFGPFKGTETPYKEGQPYRTTYKSENTLDTRIRFFVDKNLVSVGESYEFKVYVLQKGQEIKVS